MTKIDEYTSCQVKQSLPYTVNIRNSVSWTNCVEQKRKRCNEKMIFQDVNLKIYSKICQKLPPAKAVIKIANTTVVKNLCS